MKGKGRIVSYAVNQKSISLRIEMAGQPVAVEELEQYKGKTKTLRLDAFQLVGKIESITLRKTVGLLVHAARFDSVSRRLFTLLDKDALNIEVSTPEQDKLLYFLDTAARARNRKREDLLFELSSFRKNDGSGEKTIPGKRSVFDLSAAQLRVVLGKLSHLVGRKEPSCSMPSRP
ncbi:MAG: hypothetical protein ABSC55_24120 [Syntrophorhabdales bacterium]|jgi:hypothetical protein